MREFEESGARGEGRSRGQEGLDKPVKPGEEYEVTIESVGAKGDGICKIQNLVIFVPGVAQGETVRVRIKDVRQRFATAEKI